MQHLTCVGARGPVIAPTNFSRRNLQTLPPPGNEIDDLKGFSKEPFLFLIGFTRSRVKLSIIVTFVSSCHYGGSNLQTKYFITI